MQLVNLLLGEWVRLSLALFLQLFYASHYDIGVPCKYCHFSRGITRACCILLFMLYKEMREKNIPSPRLKLQLTSHIGLDFLFVCFDFALSFFFFLKPWSTKMETISH